MSNDASDIFDPKLSPASNMAAIQARGPTAIIHVGRPDSELPHKSMKRVVKLRQDNPTVPLFILVWTEEDREAMKGYEDEKVKVLFWATEEELASFLLDHLANLVGAFIVGPKHYVCPDQHLTESSQHKLVEKCSVCEKPVTFVLQNEERVKQFAELFSRVIHLSNFDTRSGEYLQTVVSPTANILKNMQYIEGCDHEKPFNAKDREKGKTAIVVGAGPSLNDAIPHLVNLSKRGDHFIICVGRVFKMLKAAGVTAHYTASCEMFDWDAAIFDNLGPHDVDGSVLAFASMCAPATVKAWPGKKTVMLDIQSAQLMGREDWIYGGNSVAHHMLNFSFQILGAKDAILVGIDLAYTKPRTHAIGANHDKWPDNIKEAEDAFQDEKWLPCTGKGDSFDPECHRTPVFMGGGGVAVSKQILVRSSPAYECFGTLFSILIAKHGKKVWNACPSGQRIVGTEYLDLAAYNP